MSKKTCKRVIAMVLSLVMMLVQIQYQRQDVEAAVGDTFTVGGLNYEVLSDNISVSVTGGTDNTITSLTIPDTVEYENYDFRVTEVRWQAFENYTNLTSVTFGQYVTYIGSNAFQGCSALTSIKFPSGLQSIEGAAFGNCVRLSSVTIPKSLEIGGDTWGGGAFEGCTSLTNVTFEEGTTKIASCLLKDCTSISSIVIPDTVEEIGSNAFEGAGGLKSVTFGSGVTTIGYGAFDECTALTDIVIPDNVVTINDDAFAGCANLVNVTLSKNLKVMDGSVFGNCNKLTSIEIPKSLEKGGDYWYGGAFEGCTSLTDVTFEEGTTCIADYLFRDCTSITKIVIPDTVTKIGSEAFLRATGLADVTIGKNVDEIESYAFSGCTRIAKIVIPDSVTILGSQSFSQCKSLESVELSKNLVKMEGSVFLECTRLNNVHIPKSLDTCGDSWDGGSFAGCTSFTNVTFEEGITTIPERLFNGCTSLESIEIPDTVVEIEDYAFRGASRLESVTLSKSLTKISDGAFYECQNLAGIELPESLVEIDDYAFYNCTRLKDVELPKGLEVLREGAFSYCTSLKSIHVPKNLTDECGGAFRGSENLTEVTFEEGITTIPAYLFSNCTGITEITIPDTVVEIGDFAFQECTGLTKVNAAENQIKTIGYDAFYNCTSLSEIACGEFSPLAIYAVDNNYPLTITNDKFEDSLLLALDRTGTDVILNSNTIKSNGYMTVMVDYAIKDNVIGGIRNKEVKIKVPDGAEIIAKSVMVDGEMVNDYEDNTEADGTISVPVENQKGKVRVSIRIANAVSMATYAVLEYQEKSTWDYKSETIGVINNYEDILTIESNSLTDKAQVEVAGVAPAKETVSIYVDGQLVTQTDANKAGSYDETITIPNVAEGKVYTISATCKDSEGADLEAECKVKYEENAPMLTGFVMYYNGVRHDLNNPKQRPNITFVPGNNYSFKVTIANRDKIDKVFVTSDRNGSTKYIEAKWDENKEAYIAQGPFEPENSSYVPGTMNVYYTLKQEPVDLVEFSNTYYEKEELPEEWQNVTVDVQEETDTTLKAKLTFEDGDVVTYTAVEMSEEEGIRYLEELIAKEGAREEAAATSDAVDTTNGAVELSGEIEQYNEGTGTKIAKLLANYGLSVTSDSFVATVRQDDQELKTFLWDGAKGTLKTVVVEETGEKLFKKGAKELFGNAVSDKFVGGAYSIAYDSINAGITYGKTTYDLNALEKEIKYSNRSEAEKQRLLQDVDTYRDVAGSIAVGRMLASVMKTSGQMTIAANPLLGVALLAGGIMIDSVFLDFYEAELNESIGCLKGLPYGSKANWCIDPSGYVYEGVTANRLPDVKATIYYKETMESDAVLWDAAQYNQMNPLYTDLDGMYAWDVPEGFWQVKYEKDGYETAYSEWLEVPPPQLNVNIGMKALAKPEVERVNVYKDYAEVIFTQYMSPETVKNVKITDVSGNEIAFALNYSVSEAAVDGTVYAKEFKLVYGEDISSDKEYTVEFLEGIKNYAQTALKPTTVTANVQERQIITIPRNVAITYGEMVKVPFEISNYVSGQTISCSTSFGDIVTPIITKDENGKDCLSLTANMYGTAVVTLMVAETGAEREIMITVGKETIVGDPEKDEDENLQKPGENEPPTSEDPGEIIPTEPAVVKGDIDANDAIELTDAQIALRMALLLISNPTDAEVEAADVDENGLVELNDAQQILRRALLLIDKFETVHTIV